ncbi:MAG TPA: tetratricopeptide repeat protein [Waddliaceae bacterium]
MNSSKLEQEDCFQINSIFFNEQINRAIDLSISQFDRTIKKYVYFSLLFLFSIIAELCFLIFFLPFLVKSSLLAFSLALIFLTSFSYLIIRLYLKTKKPEQLLEVKEKFIDSFKRTFNYSEEIPEHHLAIANACLKYSSTLQGREQSYYHILFSRWFKMVIPITQKLGSFWHWQDVFEMRELLLLQTVEEHIQLVKYAPTDLEVHAALANAYVSLSTLYVQFEHEERGEDSQWKLSKDQVPFLEKKFRATAERAIEEFKILSDFAPNDPWVQTQLAYSYHDLGMPEEEIKAYETILAVSPNDKDTLYKLGVLYFQQGHNAKGLQIYEKFKKSNYKKAELLISHYGDCNRF